MDFDHSLVNGKDVNQHGHEKPVSNLSNEQG